MGCNFYWNGVDARPRCPTCGSCGDGEPPKRLHIGKSSAGWTFALRVYPDGDSEQGPKSLDEWREWFAVPGATIVDEYGAAVTPAEMVKWITERDRLEAPPLSACFFAENRAEPGPNNLARRRVNDSWGLCIGHGDGPWDLMGRDFS